MRTSASVPAASTVASRPRTRASSSNRRNIKSSRLVRAGAATTDKSHDTEVVVIGAGIGGLCAGALLAKYGKKVTVVESHDVAGGAAHSWHRDGFTFESGPSLYSGMSKWPTTNPCGQVLHALDEPLECVYYNTWMCHLPEGSFLTEVGNDQFIEVLDRYVEDVDGVNAADEWRRLKTLMVPLAGASSALPPSAVRTDPFAAVTLARFLPGLLKAAPVLPQIMAPYSKFLDKNDIKHPFIRNWMEVLCFLLSGAPANGTLAAEIGYMFDDWYRPNSTLEFPVGGSESIVNALVRGLEKNGGRIMLRSHVEEILVRDGRAGGIKLRGGAVINASAAVISNATVWDTLPMLPDSAKRGEDCADEAKAAATREWVKKCEDTELCESFMRLHLGIDATGLPDDLEIHHIYVEDWSKGVTAPQNMVRLFLLSGKTLMIDVVFCVQVLVSIASVLDPKLAPEGKHVIHAYTPGNEPLDIWDGLDRNSDEYKKLKEERSRVLWRAVEKAIPDVRKRVEMEFVGTPLTQKRFQRRHKGSYGGTGWITEDSDTVPITTASTPIDGLMCVGDSNFPGPGVPSVAAHGWSAAHELTSFWEQCKMLDKVAP